MPPNTAQPQAEKRKLQVPSLTMRHYAHVGSSFGEESVGCSLPSIPGQWAAWGRGGLQGALGPSFTALDSQRS